MKRILYLAVMLIMVLAFTIMANAYAQHGTIYGTVVLDDGSAVPGVAVTLTGSNVNKITTITNEKGTYRFLNLSPGTYELRFELEGFITVVRKGLKVLAGKNVKVDIQMEIGKIQEQIVVCGASPVTDVRMCTGRMNIPPGIFNTEEYERIYDNRFKETLRHPLSTFSIDVDTASYANVRRFLKRNELPYKDAVRIEEMINYFDYDYPQPKGKAPFSIITEISSCPWDTAHRLIHIGLQGKEMKKEKRPPGNLVFLLDVSGSMDSPNKLPLLKSAFKLLVKQLDERDRVAIVVYAGAAGLVLPSTPGNQKDRILNAIDRLRAGGSTAGGAGVRLAYKVAVENFIEKGNNRIILATDGDFNVGVSSTSELVRLVEEKRESGVFITVLGFGMGNYKDSRMEQLADKGNGNYHYIDGILEAKKVLVQEISATLFTIAKDVKIQVEFNPARVKAYRLIGYVNRLLEDEDFEDDTKDAGELGAGHTVTALYEIIPAGSKETLPGNPKLKYMEMRVKSRAGGSKEVMTVKLRYKHPKGRRSKLIARSVRDRDISLRGTTDNFRFSAAVAQFGMLLRDSEFRGDSSFDNVLKLARGAKGKDVYGYRAEFIKLVEISQLLKDSQAKNN
jgi:Ca-activated chloride channel family protein